MSLRSYIILMLLATIACYLALGAILYFFDPFTGGLGALAFFYTSLFLSLVGTLSIWGLLMRMIFTKDQLVFKKVIASFRQAIWFALLIIIILFLQKINLLVWRNVILLVFAFAVLELFFISYKSKSRHRI